MHDAYFNVVITGYLKHCKHWCQTRLSLGIVF